MSALLVDPHHDGSERWVQHDPGSRLAHLRAEAPAASSVWLRAVIEGEPRWIEGKRGRTGAEWHFDLPVEQARTSYRFLVDGNRWLTAAGCLTHDPTDHGDFKLDADDGVPAWVADQVWYQIFPDRFARAGTRRPGVPWAQWSDWDDPVTVGDKGGPQLYGGDLDGVTSRLRHIVDLGVTGIYLTPFFPGRTAHRYDAVSFDHVDPLLGGDAALCRLVDACKRDGLRVLADLTLNHTGGDHEWFKAAVTDENSDEAGFYVFDEYPDRYLSWLGVPTLPKLDHRSAHLRSRLYEGEQSVAVRHALAFGLDGWRIDAANMVGRHGDIDDNLDVAASFRRSIDRHAPGRWLVAEHAHDFTPDVDGRGWHGAMNYAGIGAPVAGWLGRGNDLDGIGTAPPRHPHRSGRVMARTIDAFRSATTWPGWARSLSLLDSHDTARWRTVADSDHHARVGTGLLLTLPGVPCILYGDEVGLLGANGDEARAPMSWDPRRWHDPTLDWHRRLTTMHRRNRALRHGGFRWAHIDDDQVMFLRETEDQRLLIRASRAATERVRLPNAGAAVTEGGHVLGGEDLGVSADSMQVSGCDTPSFDVWELDA